MKKCFYFPDWTEERSNNIYLSLDKSSLFVDGFPTAVTKFIHPQSTPTDPILQKLCEITGAKIYGDYVVVGKRTIIAPFEVEDVATKESVIINAKKTLDEMKKLINLKSYCCVIAQADTMYQTIYILSRKTASSLAVGSFTVFGIYHAK